MSIALNTAVAPTYLTNTAPGMLAAGRTSDLRPAADHHTDSSRMPQSLDDLLVGAIQRAGASTRAQMAAIQAVMPVPELFDEGEDEMINLQNLLGDFSIAVSLQSALARKAVGAIETLIKS
ncbi:type III secretion system inner rod subunit SctI [Pararobbsia alpina]|nr:type III secretion system inner rod subunit SctI [Pararobbsia alpina]